MVYVAPYGVAGQETISFQYVCNTTALEVSDRQYEFRCYPKYHTNQTFFAPKNQDAATILCIANDDLDLGSTWAIPCNNITECDNGSDETGCKFSAWLIPSLLCGSGAVLGITLFVYLHKSIKITWKKKMQFQFQNLRLSIETEKLYKIAVLVESGHIDQIQKMYCREVENNGSEAKALCHLKVQRT